MSIDPKLKNLITALAGSDFDTELADTENSAGYDLYNSLVEVFILFGDDEYRADARSMRIDSEGNAEHLELINTPNRCRGLSGTVSIYRSESGNYWAHNMLFHKGITYESKVSLKNEEKLNRDTFELNIV